MHLVKYRCCAIIKNLSTQLALFHNSLSNCLVIFHGPIHGRFNSQKVIPTWYVFIKKLEASTHINMQLYLTILVIVIIVVTIIIGGQYQTIHRGCCK